MKKMFVLTAMFCLCLQAVAVFAATPDFSGLWDLDIRKSNLPDASRIDSMTLTVTQTEKQLRVERATKRPKGSTRNGGILNEDNGNQTVKFNLDGKETSTVISGEAILGNMIMGREFRKAVLTSDGKLSLTVSRVYEAKMGSMGTKVNEVWELVDAGNVLKVTRYTEATRGATNVELYFTKKEREGIATSIVSSATKAGDNIITGPVEETAPGTISGGILNGKALKLSSPEYPPAARAVRASGAVNVQVTFDEQGKIISARAVSGHPLLRQAAEQAARNSEFAPVLLEGVPIKVTGIIVYNFVP